MGEAGWYPTGCGGRLPQMGRIGLMKNGDAKSEISKTQGYFEQDRWMWSMCDAHDGVFRDI